MNTKGAESFHASAPFMLYINKPSISSNIQYDRQINRSKNHTRKKIAKNIYDAILLLERATAHKGVNLRLLKAYLFLAKVQGRLFLFMLIFPIDIGKQRNQKSSK